MIQDREVDNQIGSSKRETVDTTTKAASARVGWVRDWPRWTPYAAVAWSLVYAALALYWAISGRGFPYASGPADNPGGPLAGQFGLVFAWVIVIAAGLPAAAAGLWMLSGVRRPRSLLIAAGALLAGILLLLTSDLGLLTMLAYIPYTLVKFLMRADVGFYVNSLVEGRWVIAHQLFCLAGGFLWLAATVSYARRSQAACIYCGHREGLVEWTSPARALRWGRIAVYLAMVVPVFYAITRYAWAVGIPLGMSQEAWQAGQEKGLWISGLFLANVGLVGAMLMLGLMQRWGEVFPRWMIGLAGRRVPTPLAVVPAGIMSVLLVVCGISVWSGTLQMADVAEASGQNMVIVLGPVLLFPVWGLALAVATLAYYFRRRGPCKVCDRGAPSETSERPTSHSSAGNEL